MTHFGSISLINLANTWAKLSYIYIYTSLYVLLKILKSNYKKKTSNDAELAQIFYLLGLSLSFNLYMGLGFFYHGLGSLPSMMMNNKALFNTSNNKGSWRTFRNGSGRSRGRGKNRYQNNGKQCIYCHRLNHTDVIPLAI